MEPPASSAEVERSPDSAHTPWLALLALAALYAIVQIGLNPPAPKAATAPSDEFSAERAATALSNVIGTDNAPHPTGSAAHAAVRERLVAALTQLGYEPTVQETLVAGGGGRVALVRNVLARLKSPNGSAKAVLLCAHYDSVAAGPGAGDDGAGVGSLLEIARALKQSPPAARDVIFLFDDAEELGLFGAKAFVEQHAWAKDVEVVVNLEARGTSGPSTMFETSTRNEQLVRVFRHAVARPAATSAAYEVYKRMPNDTDLTVFKAAGLHGYNFAFIGGLRHYHTPLDDLAHLSRASLQHHGDNALALVSALADDGGDLSAEGDAVYADVLGVAMIAWPESRSAALASGALLVLALATLRFVRTQRARLVDVLAGAALCVVQVIAAALIGYALSSGLPLLRGDVAPWAAQPLPARTLLFGTCTLAGLWLARVALVRRASLFGLWCGAWIALASVGLVLALTVPSTCYLFVAPAIAAALVGIAASFLPADRAQARSGMLVVWALTPLALAWYPLIHGLELSFELSFGWLLAAPFGTLLAACAPSFAASSAKSVRTASTVLAAVCVLALGAALVTPTRSPDAPEVLNLVHYQDADAQKAIWQVVRTGNDLRIAPTLALDGYAPPLPRWLAAAKPPRVMAAPVQEVAAPEVTPVAPRDADSSRIRTRVRSPRRALQLSVQGSPTLRPVAVRWRERRVELRGDDVATILGIGGEEIELELAAEGTGPAELFVFDIASELPAAAKELLADRPPERVPNGLGDTSIVARRVKL